MGGGAAGGSARALPRWGWRPGRGELLIVAVVDEETGGALGAQWLTREHPEKVRCDLLINEGGGAGFEDGGRRRWAWGAAGGRPGPTRGRGAGRAPPPRPSRRCSSRCSA